MPAIDIAFMPDGATGYSDLAARRSLLPSTVPSCTLLRSLMSFDTLEQGARTLTRWTRDGTLIEPQQLAMAWGQDLQTLQAAVQRGDLFEVWLRDAPYFPAVCAGLGIEQTAKLCRALRGQKVSMKLIFLMRAHGGLGGRRSPRLWNQGPQ